MLCFAAISLFLAVPQNTYAQPSKKGTTSTNDDAARKAREAEQRRQAEAARRAAAERQRQQAAAAERARQAEAERQREREAVRERQREAAREREREAERQRERDREREAAREREREAAREREREAEYQREQERERERSREREAQREREREAEREAAREREATEAWIREQQRLSREAEEARQREKETQAETDTRITAPISVGSRPDQLENEDPTPTAPIVLNKGDQLMENYEPGLPGGNFDPGILEQKPANPEFYTGTDPNVTDPGNPTITPPASFAGCPNANGTSANDLYPPPSAIACIEAGLDRLAHYAACANWGDPDFESKFASELMSVKCAIDQLYGKWNVSNYYMQWQYYDNLYRCYAQTRTQDRDRIYELGQYFQIKARDIEKLLPQLPAETDERKRFMDQFFYGKKAGLHYHRLANNFNPEEVRFRIEEARRMRYDWRTYHSLIYLENFLSQYISSNFAKELDQRIAKDMKDLKNLLITDRAKALELAERSYYFNHAMKRIAPNSILHSQRDRELLDKLRILNPDKKY